MNYIDFISTVSLDSILDSNYTFDSISKILKDKYDFNDMIYKLKVVEKRIKFINNRNSVSKKLGTYNIDINEDLNSLLTCMKKLLKEMSSFYEKYSSETIDFQAYKEDLKRGKHEDIYHLFNRFQICQTKIFDILIKKKKFDVKDASIICSKA